jgi:hypothetical protein
VLRTAVPSSRPLSYLRSKSDVASVLLLTVCVLVSWLPRMNGPLDLRWDGAAYYVLGTSLAQGKGYRLLNEPGEIEAVQYPPLLPAIIAVHQRVLGTDDPVIVGRALRGTFFLIHLAYVLSTYVLARIFLPHPYALGATLAVVFNIFTNFLSDTCFAEIPFALVGTLFVLAHRQPGRLSALVTPVLGIATYLLRTVGITLLLAWIGESLLRKQFRTVALRIVLSMIPVLAWLGYIHHVESSPSYMHPAYPYQRAEYLFYNVSYARNASLRDPFTPEHGKLTVQEVALRFLRNLTAIPRSLGESLSARPYYWQGLLTSMVRPVFHLPAVWRIPNQGPNLLLPLVGMLTLAGMMLLLRDGHVLIPLYLLFVLAAIALTPWPEQWPRYWAPVLPFLALGFFRAVLHVWRWTPSAFWFRAAARGMAAVLVVLVFLVQGAALYHASQQSGAATYHDRHGATVSAWLFFYGIDGYRDLDAALDWLRTDARPGDVVAASMPAWVYVRTGLKAVMPPFERDRDTMQALLDSVPVRYVVVDASPIDFARDYALAVLKSSPERWSRVYAREVTGPWSTDRSRRGDFVEIYRRLDEDHGKTSPSRR